MSATAPAPVHHVVLFEKGWFADVLILKVHGVRRFLQTVIPGFDIGADEIEDPLKRRDHGFFDVVGYVEAKTTVQTPSINDVLDCGGEMDERVCHEFGRCDGSIDLKFRFALNDDVRHAFAVTWLSSRIGFHHSCCNGGSDWRRTLCAARQAGLVDKSMVSKRSLAPVRSESNLFGVGEIHRGDITSHQLAPLPLTVLFDKREIRCAEKESLTEGFS